MRESIIEYLITTTQTLLYFENATARIANVSDEIDALQASAFAITQRPKSTNGTSASEVTNLADTDHANEYQQTIIHYIIHCKSFWY